MDKRTFECFECDHVWEVDFGISRPSECPKCRSTNIHREDREGRRSHGQRNRQRRERRNERSSE